jgi:hypothetical protein
MWTVWHIRISMEQKVFDDLIAEYKDQRDAFKIMISDLEGFKKRVDQLLPAQVEARYAKLFEEKIKATTELFKTILDLRQEIMKSVKDEIELRRKFEDSLKGVDEEEKFDLRELAKQLYNINKADLGDTENSGK